MLGPTGCGKTYLAQTLARISERALRHRRRDQPHRGRLCRRGRGEYPPAPDPERRLRRRARAAGHHLHRRDRQDRPQEREPVHHARRIRRGRAAGAAQDPRGHRGFRAPAGRPQAPAAGVHPDRHHQHSLHLRRRVRRHRKDRRQPHRQKDHGLRRGYPQQEPGRQRGNHGAGSKPRICSSSA